MAHQYKNERQAELQLSQSATNGQHLCSCHKRIKAGFQVGVLTNDRMSSDVLIAMINPDFHNSVWYNIKDGQRSTQLMSYSVDMSDVCKSMDFGLPLGLSYEYKNIVLDTRYYFGLTKIDKTDNPDKARNQYLSITLGYKFHL